MLLPPTVTTPRQARELLMERLAYGGIDLRSDEAQAALLVFSELATNAVVEADFDAEPIRIQVDLHTDGVLRMSVSDGSIDLRDPRPVIDERVDLGVDLVGKLSDEWGVGPRPDGAPGKEVWVHLDLHHAIA